MNDQLTHEYRRLREDGLPAVQALRSAKYRAANLTPDLDVRLDEDLPMTYNGRNYTVRFDYDDCPWWDDYDPMAELVADRDYHGDGGVWITGGYVDHLDWATRPYDGSIPECRLDWGDRGLWYVQKDEGPDEFARGLNKRGMAKGPAREAAIDAYRRRGERMAATFAGMGAVSVIVRATDDETGHVGSVGCWYENDGDDGYLVDLAVECASEADYDRVTDLYRMGPAQEAVARLAKAVAA